MFFTFLYLKSFRASCGMTLQVKTSLQRATILSKHARSITSVYLRRFGVYEGDIFGDDIHQQTARWVPSSGLRDVFLCHALVMLFEASFKLRLSVLGNSSYYRLVDQPLDHQLSVAINCQSCSVYLAKVWPSHAYHLKAHIRAGRSVCNHRF